MFERIERKTYYLILIFPLLVLIYYWCFGVNLKSDNVILYLLARGILGLSITLPLWTLISFYGNRCIDTRQGDLLKFYLKYCGGALVLAGILYDFFRDRPSW